MPAVVGEHRNTEIEIMKERRSAWKRALQRILQFYFSLLRSFFATGITPSLNLESLFNDVSNH